MADLKTNYKDYVLDTSKNTKRKYNMISNSDGTVSLEDVTNYIQNGDKFGSNDINTTNTKVNELNNGLNTTNTKVNELNNGLNDANGEINSMNISFSSQITDISSIVEKNRADISDLSVRMGNAENKVYTNSTRINNLQEQMKGTSNVLTVRTVFTEQYTLAPGQEAWMQTSESVHMNGWTTLGVLQFAIDGAGCLQVNLTGANITDSGKLELRVWNPTSNITLGPLTGFGVILYVKNTK